MIAKKDNKIIGVSKMKYICPVCKYDGLDERPYDEEGYGSYSICPCCGFQFGVDDFPNKEEEIKKWREKWIESGYEWFSDGSLTPNNWNPIEQLNR